MKSFNLRTLIYMAVVALYLGACQGDPMNTPPNATGNLISIAINSNGVWEYTPVAVDPSTSEGEYNIVLVVLSSFAGGAPTDIHITMVPALDSLASYNSSKFDDHDPETGKVTKTHPELYYTTPGGTGAPAFTLVDGGVVTIPKGSNYGYLKIKTTPNDYFGGNYAYAYRISSVQESGYVISANNGYAITPFVTKNQYDGIYSYTGSLGRYTAGGTPLNDGLDGTIVNNAEVTLTTTGFATDDFKPLWASAVSGIAGIGVPRITVNSDNTITITPNGGAPANWGPIPGKENKYDPTTKTFTINWRWGGTSTSPTGTTRAMMVKMTYLRPR